VYNRRQLVYNGLISTERATMSIPSVEHLFWFRHDPDKFEAERAKVIKEFLDSVPAEHRSAALAMQLKIDLMREKLSPDELLKWMVQEAAELTANLQDQFAFIGHKAADLKRQCGQLGSAE